MKDQVDGCRNLTVKEEIQDEASCKICFDTGRNDGGLCWCDAGERIREEFFGND